MEYACGRSLFPSWTEFEMSNNLKHVPKELGLDFSPDIHPVSRTAPVAMRTRVLLESESIKRAQMTPAE